MVLLKEFFEKDQHTTEKKFQNYPVDKGLSQADPIVTFFFSFSVILPRLTTLAIENNNQMNEVKKKEIALQLFEAYSALSCCCILSRSPPNLCQNIVR